ncbi:MAG: hypothetical protein Q4E24_15805 [bacterium]|nr:hypothetical protein [bacterium]
MWMVESADVSEYGLAVSRRIPVRLKEGKGSMEYESRGKSREFGDPAERFQESKRGSLGGSDYTEPFLLMGEEQ